MFSEHASKRTPVSAPDRTSYRIGHWLSNAKYVDPDGWYLATPAFDGSWWPIWAEWLRGRNGVMVAPPAMVGLPGAKSQRAPAPGWYVFQH